MTVISFFTAAGFSVSLPFLSLYLYTQRGLSATLVGVVILVSGLCSAASQMFAGLLADRMGRRPLLLAVTTATMCLYGVLAALIAVSAPVLTIVIAYTVVRTVMIMMRPAVTSAVVDLTPKERLTETFGLLRVGQNVGWAAGPAAGGFLAVILSYAWLFGFAAGIAAISLVVIFLFFKESFRGTPEEVDVKTMLCAGQDRRFFVFSGLSLLVFIVSSQLTTSLSVFTVNRAGFSTVEYGFLLTLNGLLVVFLQYPLTRMTNKVSRPALLSIGAALYGLGYLSMGWVGAYSLAIAAMVVITLGEMVFSPTTLAVAGELSPKDWRGHYVGFFGLSETLGLSLGPMLGGFLLDRFTTSGIAVWGVIASLSFLAAFGFQRWAASYRRSST